MIFLMVFWSSIHKIPRDTLHISTTEAVVNLFWAGDFHDIPKIIKKTNKISKYQKILIFGYKKLVQWGGCHVSPLRQRRSPGVLRRSGRVLKALKRADKCTGTWHCTPLDCNRIVRKSEKRQLMILNEGDMALSQFCMVTVSNRKWRCYIL